MMTDQEIAAAMNDAAEYATRVVCAPDACRAIGRVIAKGLVSSVWRMEPYPYMPEGEVLFDDGTTPLLAPGEPDPRPAPFVVDYGGPVDVSDFSLRLGCSRSNSSSASAARRSSSAPEEL